MFACKAKFQRCKLSWFLFLSWNNTFSTLGISRGYPNPNLSSTPKLSQPHTQPNHHFSQEKQWKFVKPVNTHTYLLFVCLRVSSHLLLLLSILLFLLLLLFRMFSHCWSFEQRNWNEDKTKFLLKYKQTFFIKILSNGQTDSHPGRRAGEWTDGHTNGQTDRLKLNRCRMKRMTFVN